MSKRVSPLEYLFAIGNIRALERFLLTQEAFEKAADAPLDEALRIFVESNLYSNELLHVRDSQQLEGILAQELLKLRNFTKKLLLDEKLYCLLELEDLQAAKDISHVYMSQFLKEYIALLIDMHNIKTFLRLHILKEPKEKLEASLVSEGFIKKKDMVNLYEQNISALLARLEYVHTPSGLIDYADYLKDAIVKVLKEGSFVLLEKAVNDLRMAQSKKAKYFSSGPEPLVAYYFAKVNEINLMRMIILSKLNSFSEATVKERLNAVYA